MQLLPPIKVLLLALVSDCSYFTHLKSILRAGNIETIALAQPFTEHNLEPETLASLISKKQPAVIVLASSEEALCDDASCRQLVSSLPSDIPIVAVVPNFNATQIYTVLELGVKDFILPPFTPANVLPRIWRLLRNDPPCLSDPDVLLQGKLAMERLGVVGKSPALLEEIRKLRLVAHCDITVMITGETGTGKELVARAVHYLSARADCPFVPIDCGAIPADLTESELFGHERGAFTGAVTKHQGLIAAADKGTLFLDEVDALNLNVQAKLLRFLQQREYRALGSSNIVKADVRVISATNRDLQEQVRRKTFREDLYYRLNVVQLRMPALRERPHDVTLLAQHFATKHAARFNKPVREFSREALQILAMHQWPGNIRELENVVEGAVAMSRGSLIQSTDLTLCNKSTQQAGSFREAKARVVTEFEREYVTRLLNACGGNVSEAARAAGKNRRAFWELIKRHQVDVRELRASAREMSAYR
jgi:two-component system, NtrC family, response regulator GlrR